MPTINQLIRKVGSAMMYSGRSSMRKNRLLFGCRILLISAITFTPFHKVSFGFSIRSPGQESRDSLSSQMIKKEARLFQFLFPLFKGKRPKPQSAVPGIRFLPRLGITKV